MPALASKRVVTHEFTITLDRTRLSRRAGLSVPGKQSSRNGQIGKCRQVAPIPPARSAPREPAAYWQSQQSRDKLKRLGGAIYQYLDTHNHFPADIKGKDGKPLLSWRVAILPYLDLDFLYAQFKFDEPWDGPNNKKLAAFMPDVFRAQCRTARRPTPTSKPSPGQGPHSTRPRP